MSDEARTVQRILNRAGARCDEAYIIVQRPDLCMEDIAQVRTLAEATIRSLMALPDHLDKIVNELHDT